MFAKLRKGADSASFSEFFKSFAAREKYTYTAALKSATEANTEFIKRTP